MATLEECLGISELLDAADTHLPSWGLSHPDLGALLSRDQLMQATRAGTPDDRNDVLLGLAGLANVEVGDSREAAALLCWLVIPGVLSKLVPLRGPAFSSDEVNEVAARNLWLEARTFRLATSRQVAATICWRVRSATLADFGFASSVARFDRTWSMTQPLDQADLDRWLDESTDPRPATAEPGIELARLLEAAQAAGIIGPEDVEFLETVVAVARRHPDRRVSTTGLMSAVVSQEIGAACGIGASTARRRLHNTITDLSRAARSDDRLIDAVA